MMDQNLIKKLLSVVVIIVLLIIAVKVVIRIAWAVFPIAICVIAIFIAYELIIKKRKFF